MISDVPKTMVYDLAAVINREREIVPTATYGRGTNAEVRFIEYMDVSGATEWSRDKVFTRAEMLGRLGRRYGLITPVAEVSSAPAQRFTLPDGTVLGIIASMTTPFCRTCDRSRLTADGRWYLFGTHLRSLSPLSS